MRHQRTSSRRTLDQQNRVRARPKAKRGQSRTLPWRQILLLPLALCLLAGIIYLWFSGILKLSYLEVAGNNKIDNAEVLDRLADFQGDNILMIRQSKVVSVLLTAFPELSAVEVTKHYFPNRLSIRLEEKTAFLIWHTGSEAFLIDDNGVIIGQAELGDDALPILYAFGASPRLVAARAAAEAELKATENADFVPIESSTAEVSEPLPSLLGIGDKVADKSYLLVVHDLSDKLTQVIGDRKIEYFESGEAEDLALLLSDGLEIQIKTTHTISSTLERLETTLAEAQRVGKPLHQYVDLRFEKVYGK